MFQQFFRNRFGQKRDDNLNSTGGRRGQWRGTSQGQSGGGRGGGNKQGSGPGGNCICPKCGHKEPHVAGQRCIDQICPKCGTKMMRE